MKKATTKAYDFPYRAGKKMPPVGLPGDPALRREQTKQRSKGPRPPHVVTGLVLVTPEEHKPR